MALPARLRSLLLAAMLSTVIIPAASAQSAPTDSASAADTEAAPGIPLPVKGLVWILVPTPNKAKLSRLYVHSAAENMHRGKNFAKSAFFLDAGVTVDLPGKSAKTRMDSHTPVLFVRMTTDEQEAQDSRAAGNEPVNQYRVVLLRLEAAGPGRVVWGFRTNPIAGKPKLVADEVPVLTEQIAGSNWRKITPRQPLEEGEYALSFVDEAGTEVSADVYDFGIGPAPPAKNP